MDGTILKIVETHRGATISIFVCTSRQKHIDFAIELASKKNIFFEEN